MIYVDTSVLVSLLVPEPDSESVQQWFAGHRSNGMTISDWSLVEFASAMAVQVRHKGRKAEQAIKAREKLSEILVESLHSVSPSRAAYARASELCADHSSGLRAGDALHVAVAVEERADGFVTLDRKIMVAVRRLKLDIEVIRPE